MSARRRTIRVVLADDHAMIRRGIRRILERNSNILVVAESSTGAGAIRFVQQLQPDLLLLDIELPDMKGYEVARELRARHNKVSILVLSTCDDDHFIEEVFQSGINGYLNKSEVPAKMIDAVHRVFESYTNAELQSVA
jgi:DNA-binding NarL/FixJ family response regulator